MVRSAILFFPGSVLKRSFVRVMATKQFHRSSSIFGTRIAFSPISTDQGKSTGDVFFAWSRDEPRAVTFTPVAGRVQVSGDFAFEA